MAPPIKVEYAKSARSRCTLKQCNLFILKGELRIGTGSMMPGAEELSYKWRHLCCFTGRQIKNMGASVDNIEGFEDMEEPHQAIIHKMLKGQLEGDSTVKGAVISAVIAGAAGDGGEKKGAAKKKAPGVGALLMGHSNADLSQASPTQKETVGKKRMTRAETMTLDGFLVDCGVESDATDEYEVGVTDQKPSCPYGVDCYHKNPQHFARYRHPGDADVRLSDGQKQPTIIRKVIRERRRAAPSNSKASAAAAAVAAPPAPSTAFNPTPKPMCPYGELCVLKTPAHMLQYRHGGEAEAPSATFPKKFKVAVNPSATAPPPPAPFHHVANTALLDAMPHTSTAAAAAGKPPCPYLPMCLRSDAKHLADYSHSV